METVPSDMSEHKRANQALKIPQKAALFKTTVPFALVYGNVLVFVVLDGQHNKVKVLEGIKPNSIDRSSRNAEV